MATKSDANDVEARLLVIIGKLATVNTTVITPESTWRQIGLDSLDLFELYLTCEQEFGVKIVDSQALNFYRVRDVIAYLREKMEKG